MDVVMTLRLRLRLRAAVTSAVPVKRALGDHEIISSDLPFHLVPAVCIIENSDICSAKGIHLEKGFEDVTRRVH
jgi:hypothetical protein